MKGPASSGAAAEGLGQSGDTRPGGRPAVRVEADRSGEAAGGRLRHPGPSHPEGQYLAPGESRGSAVGLMVLVTNLTEFSWLNGKRAIVVGETAEGKCDLLVVAQQVNAEGWPGLNRSPEPLKRAKKNLLKGLQEVRQEWGTYAGAVARSSVVRLAG